MFKAVKNRQRRGYVDCQQVGLIDQNLFFFKPEATHFETMMTTVHKVNNNKKGTGRIRFSQCFT